MRAEIRLPIIGAGTKGDPRRPNLDVVAVEGWGTLEEPGETDVLIWVEAPEAAIAELRAREV